MITALLCAAALAKDGSGVYHKPGSGVVVRAEDSKAELTINTWVQPAFSLGFSPMDTTLELRRGRLSLTGSPSESLSASLEIGVDRLDPRVVDAYAQWSPNKALRVRVGRMRPPSGLERETSARDLPTLERSGVAQLVPERSEAIELRLRQGPATLSVAAIVPANTDPWVPPQALDLAATANLRGETWMLGLHGGALPRPLGAPSTVDDSLLGGDLLIDRPWTGWGTQFGADALVLLGPLRVLAEGAGLREGATVGTLDAHTLHGAGYVLLGFAPSAERGKVGDAAPLKQGWEAVLRVDGRVAAPAPGVGSVGWWAGGVIGGSWAPQPSTRLSAELGSTWIQREGDSAPSTGFISRVSFTVGF